ncbi:hypothetical protein Barb4_02932 [Bacteroidales bacterium Barb4]|nr:hypothetical protein Barb4_02932 [Bacteroidales bacterium Barb4]
MTIPAGSECSVKELSFVAVKSSDPLSPPPVWFRLVFRSFAVKGTSPSIEHVVMTTISLLALSTAFFAVMKLG